MSIIEVQNATYYYGGERTVAAVKDVSFSVEEGEFVVLAGRNGSGKSTVAKLLNGLLLPAAGKILVDGIDTADDARLYDLRRTAGVVFQNPDNQTVATIIEDDVAFGPENLGLPPAEIRERVDWALAAVGMSEYAKKTPFRLSGGQKQRVAIAGVLAIRPKILIMDESTSMLDPEGRRGIMELLHELNARENLTIILITHFMSEAVNAGRVIVMDEGRIVKAGGRELFLDEEGLKSFGLDVPVEISVANELRRAGLGIGNVMNITELADELCR
ncbi:MAG: energy-coupling factor transporter ATPase [Firmicutes bacterium]|nr:energy-coupling factor transporter ATPase [Bacillota bacterium]